MQLNTTRSNQINATLLKREFFSVIHQATHLICRGKFWPGGEYLAKLDDHSSVTSLLGSSVGVSSTGAESPLHWWECSVAPRVIIAALLLPSHLYRWRRRGGGVGGRGSCARHWGYLGQKHTVWREGGGSLFLTEGLLVSAHRAQGQPPWERGIPPGGWVRCGSLAQ